LGVWGWTFVPVVFVVSPWCRRRQLNNSLPLGGGHKTRQNHLLHGNLRPNQTVLWRLVTCVGWHLRVAWQAQYFRSVPATSFSQQHFVLVHFTFLWQAQHFVKCFCGGAVVFLWLRFCGGVVFL